MEIENVKTKQDAIQFIRDDIDNCKKLISQADGMYKSGKLTNKQDFLMYRNNLLGSISAYQVALLIVDSIEEV
jgi:hypothetical protein